MATITMKRQTKTSRRPSPRLDLAYRELRKRPAKGMTSGELASRIGASQAAATMLLHRLRDAGKAQIVGATQSVDGMGRKSRYANVWRAV